jgi:hypothetical protein
MTVQTNTTVRRSACDVNRNGRIAWLCEVCNNPIGGKAGYLTVDRERAMRQSSDEQERQQRWRDEGRLAIPLSEFLDAPGPVRWQVLHLDCDLDLERDGDYWFHIERADTSAKMLDWSAHLMGKTWLEETDWDSVLRRVATAAGGAAS